MLSTKLERAVFDWFADHHPSISDQVRDTTVVRREYTGVGFYAYLSLESGCRDPAPISGPTIESPWLNMGAGAVLWLLNGAPYCLEVYAFGASFPENLDEFTLSCPKANVIGGSSSTAAMDLCLIPASDLMTIALCPTGRDMTAELLGYAIRSLKIPAPQFEVITDYLASELRISFSCRSTLVLKPAFADQRH